MVKTNKIFVIGLIIVGLTLLINRFIDIPDILYGLLFGIGGTCEVIGMYLIANNK